MTDNKKTYFISDAHLGYPDQKGSLGREKKIVSFLDSIRSEAESIYLLGDIFDFWYEYKSVVPRGYTRLLGKLAELSDSGIRIYFFTGNHDIWAFSYLEEELGLEIQRNALIKDIGTKTFFLAHGDGTDPTDKKFLFIKKIFHNHTLQWLFSRLHPNFAFWLAGKWSRQSRLMNGTEDFLGEKEPMVIYSRENLLDQGLDFIIFGHRHCPVDYSLNEKTRMIILGDWLTHFTYGEFDGENFELKTYI